MKISAMTIFEGSMKFTYNGIPCLKCPFDYAIYQKILFDIKPDLVIEIGTNMGGSALYMADIMNVIGNGVLHTIDVKSSSALDEKVCRHKRIKLFEGGWQGYDLSNANGFEKILIIDDASHIYEDVLGALNKFSCLISKDSYFIVEDGIINELGWVQSYRGSPIKAIEEFLKINSDFIIDRSLCDFFGVDATFNINGYLKKINAPSSI